VNVRCIISAPSSNKHKGGLHYIEFFAKKLHHLGPNFSNWTCRISVFVASVAFWRKILYNGGPLCEGIVKLKWNPTNAEIDSAKAQ
jgi:hypothetical protein